MRHLSAMCDDMEMGSMDNWDAIEYVQNQLGLYFELRDDGLMPHFRKDVAEQRTVNAVYLRKLLRILGTGEVLVNDLFML